MQINLNNDLVGWPLGAAPNRSPTDREMKRITMTAIDALDKSEMPRPAEIIARLFKPLDQNLPGPAVTSFLPRLNQRRRSVPVPAEAVTIPKKTFNLEDYKDEIDPGKFAILSRVLGSVYVGLTREEVQIHETCDREQQGTWVNQSRRDPKSRGLREPRP